MAGKPCFRLVAVAKDDKTKRLEIAAVWEGKFPGAYQVRLSKAYGDRPGVARIVFTDGTELTPESPYWLNMNAPRDEGGRDEAPAKAPQQDADPFGDDDEPPF